MRKGLNGRAKGMGGALGRCLSLVEDGLQLVGDGAEALQGLGGGELSWPLGRQLGEHIEALELHHCRHGLELMGEPRGFLG